MTIKEASKKTGVSIDNLRYYERIGLIPPIPRNKSGIREYDEQAIHRILYIMQFKKTGMSLESIIEYMKLAHSDSSAHEIRCEMLLELRDSLETKISELQECLTVTNDKIEKFYDLNDPLSMNMISKYKDS